MSRRLLLLAMLSVLVVWGASASANIVPGYAYKPGEVIIKFRSDATAAAKATVLAAMPSDQIKVFKGIQAEQRHLRSMSVQEAIDRIGKDPAVEYVEPNYILHALGIPNDPMFPDLWGMNNTGQSVTGGRAGTPDADIDAPEAWSIFTGSPDALVCVIDTGINYNHPDLAANAWTNPDEIAGNGIDDDGNGYIDDIHGYDFVNSDNDPMDDHGHGSHCSGTIGGVGDNGIGVAGVNWRVKIMGCKFLDADGYGDTADAISAIEYAIDKGVDVMSNSWGGGPYDAAMEAAIQNAYLADIFFVAAAGNDGTDNDATPHYPSSYTNPNVIAVMATDSDDNPVDEAGWWATCYGATSVDVAAPGLYIWSTVLGTGYDNYSGTSMATPHVSGAMALLRGRFPGITVDAGKNLLMTVGNDPKPQLAGLCVTGGRLNLLKLISDPDVIPPGQIADLGVTETGSNWLTVAWTATGDDGGAGTAFAYDLRYSLAPIDDTNWATATPVIGEPLPQPAGSAESLRVHGLTFSTPYYFAIKALDEYGNAGSLSNVASGTTLGAPTVGTSPASLSASLPTGGTTTRTLTVSNVGEGVLDFTVGAEYLMAKHAAVRARTVPDLELAKGQPDPRIGDAVIMGHGGPDAFGYRWVDSDDPGGPAYDWIEISGVGTALTMTDDSNQGPFPIGFTFKFYGNDFTTFRVGSNGFISFSSTSTTAANQSLPHAAEPFNQIAPFWDDLNPASGGGVYYYNDGTRLIVEWNGVPHYSAGGPYSFQAHLYPGGRIEYHYKTMGSPLDGATIGIQNATGTDGLQIAFNAAYIHDSMAVRISSIPPWLSFSPMSGSVAAGGSQDVTVTFDAAELCASQFGANVHVVSNDPITPDAIVPATLTLIAQPDIRVAPVALDFGNVYVTATRSLDVVVGNVGCTDLNVTQVATTGDYSADPAPFVVPAAGTHVVHVVFAPTVAGTRPGTLDLTSDDPDAPVLTVPLTGVGLDYPDIAVDPETLEQTLPTGGNATQTLTVSNHGAGALNFTIPAAEFVTAKQSAAKIQPVLELAKGAPDPRIGDPVLTSHGGPDTFGYRWTDSDDPGGPAFNWIEIASLGTALTMTDDSNVGPNPIGFTFKFYGTDFTTFRVCSNGFLSFTSTSTALTNQALPNAAEPFNLLAPFWDDLNPTVGGHVYYYNDGTRLIVEWKDVPHYTTSPPYGGPYSFQVQLYPSGRIEYHYLSVLPPLDSCTVGMQNATGTDALQVVFNAAYLHDNLAIRFQSMPEWVTVTPTAGTVPPGGSQDVTVRFDAAGLCGDQFHANLHVLSNDPDTPDKAVPATLLLQTQPDLLASPAALDFGDVYLTSNKNLPLQVMNAGCATLNVTQVAITGDYAVPTTPFTVAVGGTVVLTVTFAPTAAGARAGTLTLTSDDPDTPVLQVPLTGNGLNTPRIATVPATRVDQTQPAEVQRVSTLLIQNTGVGQLDFTIPTPSLYSKEAAAAGGEAPKPEFREYGKDEIDPRVGSIEPQGHGGPDSYGYRWTDSDDPGGPAYSWIDITTTGTRVTLADDGNVGPYPIGFTYKYYGNQFDTFRICSNGWLSFTSSLTSYDNQPLPYASGPDNLIAPFWDDLNPSTTGGVYYASDGHKLVVEWAGVPHYSSGGPYTFEAIIYDTGAIVFQYQTLAAPLNSCTIGIEDATRTVALQTVYNANYVHDGLAIRYSALPQWLTTDVTSGSIPPHGSQMVLLNFDSAGLAAGLHEASLRVLSNDVQHPALDIPVSLHVGDATGVGDLQTLPKVAALDQNRPNPFNPATTIRFALPSDGRAVLNVYDTRGGLVRRLLDETMGAGDHTVLWDGRTDDGRQVASGVYFYKLQAGSFESIRRMVLVK